MNAKIVFAFLLVAVAVCCAVQAEKLPEMPSMSQGMQTLKGINMSKIQDQMKGMQGEMGKFDATKMNQYFKDMYTKMTAAAKANKLPTAGQQEQRLTRTRREAEVDAMAPLEPTAPVDQAPPAPTKLMPVSAPQASTITQQAASPEQVAVYEENLDHQENSLRMMMRSMINSPYMPSREQIIQIATTVITLVLVLMLGPAAGANSGLVQALVKQVVPMVLAALFHYAADSASKQVKPPEAPITSVQLTPVSAPPASTGQTI